MLTNVVPSNYEWPIPVSVSASAVSVTIKLSLLLRSEILLPWSEGRDMTSFQSSVTSFLFQYRRICNKANNANYKLDMETFLDKKKKEKDHRRWNIGSKKNVCLHTLALALAGECDSLRDWRLHHLSWVFPNETRTFCNRDIKFLKVQAASSSLEQTGPKLGPMALP